MKLLIVVIILVLNATFFSCGWIRNKNFESGNSLFDTEFKIQIEEGQKMPISPLLMGFNIVYAYEADTIWSDGKLAGYLTEMNTGILRYPGGTVSTYYHWNELTGEGWRDSWDPENPVTPRDSSGFMTLDQYISLINNTGATPLLGINMCSGFRWNRMEDGLSEALELMKYCMDRDFNVKYWYLGNEPYMEDSNGGRKTVEQYASLINYFAPEMKKLNPDIEIIANWNAAFKLRTSDYQKLLSMAGHNIDYIDVHWYWKWSEPTWAKWLKETPIELWTGDTYLQEIDFFREMTKDMGFPQMKLASLEWNVGPIREKQLTSHQCAFIQSEMLLSFMAAGLDMACFWPLHGPGQAVAQRSIIDPRNRNFLPVYQVFSFLGELQGQFVLNSNLLINQKNFLGIVATDKSGDTIWLCIINKNDYPVSFSCSSTLLEKMKPEKSTFLALENDGFGSETGSLEINTEPAENGISFSAKGLSVNMIKLNKKL